MKYCGNGILQWNDFCLSVILLLAVCDVHTAVLTLLFGFHKWYQHAARFALPPGGILCFSPRPLHVGGQARGAEKKVMDELFGDVCWSCRSCGTWWYASKVFHGLRERGSLLRRGSFL